MTRQEFYDAGRSLFSFPRWRNRVVFWCGAIVIGIIAAGFAYMSDYAQKYFMAAVSFFGLLPLLICPFIFALTAWLTLRFCPYAVGSGIPQAIAARSLDTHKERNLLLGLPIVVGKIFLTALGLLGGASVGREGPTVQIGAAILYFGGHWGKINAEIARSVILAGAAAGVAAAFNTPLAGIVFAIEEMARSFEYKHSSIVLTAIIFAGASSMSILGNYSYFGYADGGFVIGRDILAIAAIGVGGGLMGGLFAHALVGGGRFLQGVCRRRNIHPVVFAAACGLAIAFLGLMTNDATFGSGYAQAEKLLYGQGDGAWLYTIAKFLATAISGFSGIPGGIFSPSLSVGAGFGASMAEWFPATPVAGIVLLGMAAYFAGVTQAPITAFIIVLEVSGRESMPVPLIAAAVIAAGTSRLICPVSLYHMLAKDFVALIKSKIPDGAELPQDKKESA